MVKRYHQILGARSYDIVIVRRSVLLYNDYGNLFFEKFLKSVHPNIILDFDDDLNAGKSDRVQSRGVFELLMQQRRDHFYESFEYYSGFLVGSDYLKRLVLEHCASCSDENIAVIPTCVDYDTDSLKNHDASNGDKRVIFGWIGGNQNLPYLKAIIPSLNKLSRDWDIRLHVIAGVDTYELGAEFPVQFIRYSLETEVQHLRSIDIGLMPMPDNAVTRGKCGFKLIQYMGLGIPGIASAVGVNNDIVDHDRNGWLVPPDEDWETVFRSVIQRRDEWPEIGRLARKRIEESYSYEAHFSSYLDFIRKMGNINGRNPGS